MAEMNTIIPRDYGIGPGIQPDDTIVEASQKIFRYQLNVMRTFERDVRFGSEAEPLHKMRVAVRRMRMAYRVLGAYISKPVINPYVKDLRKLGDALGVVRDLDVMLINAETFRLSLSGETQSNFESMMAYFNEDRRIHRRELLELLDSHWYLAFNNKFGQVINASQYWAVNIIETGKINLALPIAREIIRLRYQKILEFDPITKRETIDQLHKLRIRIKGFRYTVEFFEEILGNGAIILIDILTQIQNYLGELNDTAVACNYLENLLEDDTFLNYHQEGVIAVTSEYLTNMENQIRNSTTSFSSIWEIIHQPHFLEALSGIISF